MELGANSMKTFKLQRNVAWIKRKSLIRCNFKQKIRYESKNYIKEFLSFFFFFFLEWIQQKERKYFKRERKFSSSLDG